MGAFVSLIVGIAETSSKSTVDGFEVEGISVFADGRNEGKFDGIFDFLSVGVEEGLFDGSIDGLRLETVFADGCNEGSTKFGEIVGGDIVGNTIFCGVGRADGFSDGTVEG